MLSLSFGSHDGFCGNPTFSLDNLTVTTAPIININLKKDQIIIGAVVTVRLSSGNVGFPQNPTFDPNDLDNIHNRLFLFMLIEFWNQKSFSNMALQGIINFLLYLIDS